MSHVRLALAQIAPKLGDRAHNEQLHLERIEEAAGQGASVVIFPELSLTGYFLRDIVPDVAVRRDGPEMARLAEAAGRHGLDVVIGFVEESAEHHFYNSVAYFEGAQLRSVHRKVFLPTYGMFDERRYFAAGERIAAFETQRLGRVGMLVCEDFWHLSALAILQAEEVDWIVCVANSPARGVAGPRVRIAETYERLARTFAEMLGCAVAFVDRVGFEDGLCFWGGSLVVGPDAEIVAQGPDFDESLVMVDFDQAELRRARLATPLARDERLLLLLEELERIKRERYA